MVADIKAELATTTIRTSRSFLLSKVGVKIILVEMFSRMEKKFFWINLHLFFVARFHFEVWFKIEINFLSTSAIVIKTLSNPIKCLE